VIGDYALAIDEHAPTVLSILAASKVTVLTRAA